MSTDYIYGIGVGLLSAVIFWGVATKLPRHENKVVSVPTTLYLTVVSGNGMPQICNFKIATETSILGDNLHVVVEKSNCPALQEK